MSEEETDDPVPSETDTLIGGESGDEFDLKIWEMRLAAGKYDGALLLMSAALNDRAVADNRRRWRVTFREVVYEEDDVDAEVADHAERFAAREGQQIQGWGYICAFMEDNVKQRIGPPRAVLYGICRAELGMTDRDARRAIKMTNKEIMGCFEFYEVESPGKSGEPD